MATLYDAEHLRPLDQFLPEQYVQCIQYVQHVQYKVEYQCIRRDPWFDNEAKHLAPARLESAPSAAVRLLTSSR